MLTAIGSAALIVGLSCAWLDMMGNGAQQAEWAGFMLLLATVGAVLMGADYYGGR